MGQKSLHTRMHADAPTEPHIRRDYEASECQVILKGNQVLGTLATSNPGLQAIGSWA